MAAPTAILYNGKRLIPAPRLAFSRSHRRSGDQSIIGTEHQVTITGELVGCKGWDFSGGSPDFYTGSGYPADDPYTTCDSFVNLVNMQEKLRELFAVDGDYHWFEVIGCSGLIRKWRARTISIDFAEGPWTDIVPYTIVLGLQTDAIDDDDLHIDHTETWDVQWDEENGGVYTLSHTLSCQSEEFANDPNDISDGWKQAKAWVDDRLTGADYTTDAPNNIKNQLVIDGLSVLLGTDYEAYNYNVQRAVDEYTGTYSVTETWVLAKDSVFRTWTLAFNKPRDEYASVSMNGEFRHLINRTETTEVDPTNITDAIDAYNTWEGAGQPYSIANAYYIARGGCTALGDCPVNRSVTIVEESRGDGSDAFGEATRAVQFSFEYTDADADAEVSITRSWQKSYVANNCENKVTVAGQIQGHTCDCATTKLQNAQTEFATIDPDAEALAVSGISGLTRTSSSYTENERDGTIEFSYEYTDRFDSGVIKDERITVAWACGELKSNGTSKTTYSVEGTLTAACADSLPTAPDPSTYFTCDGASCCRLLRKSVTRDATNNIVNYQYEYDDDCGPGLVEISVETSIGPDNCGVVDSTVEFSVQGIGCTSADMLTNAQSALAPLSAANYAPIGSCLLSKKTNTNQTRGTIQETYQYTTECDATAVITITEAYDHNDCEDLRYTVEGEIKGACFATGGAMVAAEALYQANYLPTVYAAYGCLSSKRVSRTEKHGTLRFTYEFKDCESGYEHEQSISTKTDNQDCCTEITVSGTITPYCDPATGEAGMVTQGETIWTGTVEPSLAGIAAGYCSTTPTLRSTMVTRNKKNGQIQYSYTYMCCDTLVTGALKESINITKDFPAAVVAIVPILGRTCGPIIQDKGTKTVERCSIAIDLTFEKQCGGSLSKPSGLEAQIQSIISSVGCCSTAYNSHQDRDQETWNPRTGRYTRNVSFICECC